MQVTLGTDGRPLDASIETWAGPGNTPRRMRVYSEDGYLRPFHSAEPPRGQANTMAVRTALALTLALALALTLTLP